MVNVPDAGVPKTGAIRVIPLAIVPATMFAAGKPEQLVNVPDAGVPKTGATKVIPDARVPATIFAAGSPEQFVRVPEAGVPSAGVVKVGEVRVLLVSVCESLIPTMADAGAVKDVPQLLLPE